jgi:hypothetical protein
VSYRTSLAVPTSAMGTLALAFRTRRPVPANTRAVECDARDQES